MLGFRASPVGFNLHPARAWTCSQLSASHSISISFQRHAVRYRSPVLTICKICRSSLLFHAAFVDVNALMLPHYTSKILLHAECLAYISELLVTRLAFTEHCRAHRTRLMNRDCRKEKRQLYTIIDHPGWFMQTSSCTAL